MQQQQQHTNENRLLRNESNQIKCALRCNCKHCQCQLLFLFCFVQIPCMYICRLCIFIRKISKWKCSDKKNWTETCVFVHGLSTCPSKFVLIRIACAIVVGGKID